MKFKLSITITYLLCILCFVKAQPKPIEFTKAELYKQVESITNKDKNGKIAETEVVVYIKCIFKNTVLKDSLMYDSLFKTVEKWKILPISAGQTIYKIRTEMVNNERCHVFLYGDFQAKNDYTIKFDDPNIKMPSNNPLKVEVPKSFSPNNIEYGEGKSIDLKLSRLAEQKAFYAFEYNFNVNIVKYNFQKVNLLHNLSLVVNSKGALGTDDTVRNGTQTSLGLELNPYIFINSLGLDYECKLSVSYQIETKTNSKENMVFDILNKSWSFGLKTEIPLTDYPMLWIHEHNFYRRGAMPIILEFNFLPKGKSGSGDSTLQRYDFTASWELAFSPYFIFQGVWSQSNLFNAPVGEDNSPKYWSLSIAQDLDAVKQVLGFLKFILGDGDEIKGKNFIYFKVSDGSKAPAFQKKRELKLGFATYL